MLVGCGMTDWKRVQAHVTANLTARSSMARTASIGRTESSLVSGTPLSPPPPPSSPAQAPAQARAVLLSTGSIGACATRNFLAIFYLTTTIKCANPLHYRHVGIDRNGDHSKAVHSRISPPRRALFVGPHEGHQPPTDWRHR